MRLTNGRWAGIALLAVLFATAPVVGPVVGQGSDATQQVRTGSFSGAYLAGRIAETDNDLEGAIGYYGRALSFDPENQSLRQSLMLALIGVGRFDEALQHAELLKTVPEVERFSRLALAIKAIKDEDFIGAEALLKLALQSDLDRLITGLMSAWVKLGAGDADGALALIDELEGPEWYSIFRDYHRALVAEAAGRSELADDAYEATINNVAAGGAAPETYMRAVEAYARMAALAGEEEKALAILETGDAFALNRPAIMGLRRDIESRAVSGPLVDGVGQGAAEVLLNLGSALNRGGGEAFVRLYLQYALALMPDNDSVLVQLGQVSEQQGKAEEAISFYERVPASSPLKRVSELQLGLNLADLDRHEEAKVHLRALVDEDPDDMRAYLALGGVYASKEEYREAAELYDDAVARIEEPTRAEWNIFYQRGIAYERLKEWPKAEPNFKKALELFPDQPQVLNYLGYSWVDMNMNLEEGLDLIRRAVDLRPNDGYIVDSLGWAYYRLGRYEDAVRELERAVSLRPDDPILNDHLGDAYWRVGRRLEARFQWSHARDMNPDDTVMEDVRRKLAEGLPSEEDRRAAREAAAPQPAAPAPEPERQTPPSSDRSDAGQATGTLAEPAVYRVQPGQSLWSIAADVLGDGRRYPEILELNPALQGNPRNIRPGQELSVPLGQ